jgi:rod shape-determining protein MreD
MTVPRALGLLLVAYLGTVLATAMAALWNGPVPDLGFLVALYAGLHCRLTGGPAATLRDAHPEAMAGLGAAMGYLMDLLGGTPLGLRALVCALWLLGLRVLSSRFLVRGRRAVMAVAALCALLFRLSMWLIFVAFSFEGNRIGLRNAVTEALLTGLCAPFLFAGLRALDSWLLRDLRAQRGGLSYESADAKR